MRSLPSGSRSRRGARATSCGRATLAAWVALAAMGCPGSSGTAQGAGNAEASGAGAQGQPGGATVWVDTSSGVARNVALGIGDLAGGATLTAIAEAAGPAPPQIVLLAVDESGLTTWSRRLVPSCSMAVLPLGSVASGSVFLGVRDECGGTVTGLGQDPIPAGGALVLLDPAGKFVRALAVPGELVDAAIDDGGHALVLCSSPAGSALASIAEDGTQRWAHVLDATGRHVAATPGGGAVVLLASHPPRIVRLDGSGALAWTRDLPDALDARAVSVLTDGAVAVLGAASAEVSWGGAVAGVDGGSRSVLLVSEPDGTPRTVTEIPASSSGEPPGTLAALPHGRVLVAGFGACDRLRALSPQLDLAWDRAVDARCAASASAAITTSAGMIAVAGQFVAPADFGNGFVVEPAGTAEAFVLGLWP